LQIKLGMLPKDRETNCM